AGEQHGRDVGGAHRQTGMTRIGLLHGIHGKETDRIGHAVVHFACGHDRSLVVPRKKRAGYGPESEGTHSRRAPRVNVDGGSVRSLEALSRHLRVRLKGIVASAALTPASHAA